MTLKTVVAAAQLLLCVLAMAGLLMAQTQATPAAASPNPELTGMLTSQLHVSPHQAVGGAGAIFGLAKSRLNPKDFGQLSSVVPGMDGLLKAAPTPKAGPSSSIGSLGSMVPGKAGGMASLAGSFQSLNLSPSMAAKFIPVIKNYVGAKGGTGMASMFAGAMK